MYLNVSPVWVIWTVCSHVCSPGPLSTAFTQYVVQEPAGRTAVLNSNTATPQDELRKEQTSSSQTAAPALAPVRCGEKETSLWAPPLRAVPSVGQEADVVSLWDRTLYFRRLFVRTFSWFRRRLPLEGCHFHHFRIFTFISKYNIQRRLSVFYNLLVLLYSSTTLPLLFSYRTFSFELAFCCFQTAFCYLFCFFSKLQEHSLHLCRKKQNKNIFLVFHSLQNSLESCFWVVRRKCKNILCVKYLSIICYI